MLLECLLCDSTLWAQFLYIQALPKAYGPRALSNLETNLFTLHLVTLLPRKSFFNWMFATIAECTCFDLCPGCFLARFDALLLDSSREISVLCFPDCFVFVQKSFVRCHAVTRIITIPAYLCSPCCFSGTLECIEVSGKRYKTTLSHSEWFAHLGFFLI